MASSCATQAPRVQESCLPRTLPLWPIWSCRALHYCPGTCRVGNQGRVCWGCPLPSQTPTCAPGHASQASGHSPPPSWPLCSLPCPCSNPQVPWGGSISQLKRPPARPHAPSRSYPSLPILSASLHSQPLRTQVDTHHLHVSLHAIRVHLHPNSSHQGDQ